ncbi:uncharacterized protein TRUGW13939_02079 [Talaromyces rugulosus]|uniref:Uncharacterized protein n=1 Tax=Talaromyces rugulosus TaxID=121627 RepID=A0A7H8QM36_TALRU|nr:uncharacterized protein TRUGW13939_02079 [Talaromyces rugulosus]QKX54989.1 hypothetical protein TRUGW13939_02079 [Talaromyces rugulosus]
MGKDTKKTIESTSLEKALESIRETLDTSSDEVTVELDKVSSKVADKVIEYLDNFAENQATRLTYDAELKVFRVVVMPTPTHEAHIDWLHQSILDAVGAGHLTSPESKRLRLSGANRKRLTNTANQTSTKEPDALLIPFSVTVPTIVVETGWSESKRQLVRDKNIWLGDTRGQVQAVIVIKWRPNYHTREVSGVLEVHKPNASPNGTLDQTEKIFPIPTNGTSQVIQFTKAELFAGSPMSIQNPGQLIDFTLDALRLTAQEAMQEHGFNPKP